MVDVAITEERSIMLTSFKKSQRKEKEGIRIIGIIYKDIYLEWEEENKVAMLHKVKCQCAVPREYDEIIIWEPKTFKCVKTTCLKCHKIIRIISGHCGNYLERSKS
jgi:hypothetical protein